MSSLQLGLNVSAPAVRPLPEGSLVMPNGAVSLPALRPLPEGALVLPVVSVVEEEVIEEPVEEEPAE